MSLTLRRLLPAFLLFVTLLTVSAPAHAAHRRQPKRPAAAVPSTLDRLSLYSARVRRSTVTYLRLRLLELREADLDEARAAIERRLSVDELIAGSLRRDGRADKLRRQPPIYAPPDPGEPAP